MTKKLYHDRPYQTTFTSHVLKNVSVNGNPAVVLNQTLFYPTAGGQPHDTGLLNSIPVVDVMENEEKEIVHVLDSPIDGTAVEGQIDWQRRFDHMQQHSGQHILSQAMKSAFKADTLSFHLGEESATIDVDRPGFDTKMITRIEEIANHVIFENRPITAHAVDKEELHRFHVRKPPTVEENIRIIVVEDFDSSPCGGTHCTRTGEIGILKIRQFENYKGGSRIHFLCGGRALKDYQRKSGILKQLTRNVSAGEEELNRIVQKTQNDLASLRHEHRNITKQLIENEALALTAESISVNNRRILKRVFHDLSLIHI